MNKVIHIYPTQVRRFIHSFIQSFKMNDRPSFIQMTLSISVSSNSKKKKKHEQEKWTNNEMKI